MDDSSETRQPEDALSRSERIHIAHIDHNYLANHAGHIEANVVLVWPYSSQTKELSLLLAERDVVLRKAKGQVKVTFHLSCAREVAYSRIGIGERVKLGLNGAEVVEEADHVSTPGKKAGFTLHYTDSVQLQVIGNDDQIRHINYLPSPTYSPIRNGRAVAFETPNANQTVDISLTKLATSPYLVFRTGSRLSSNSFPGSFTDPFEADDGSVAGRGRKRTKFGRHSGAWRFVDDSEEHESAPQNGLHLEVQNRSPSRVIDLTEDETPVATPEDAPKPVAAVVDQPIHEPRHSVDTAQNMTDIGREPAENGTIDIEQPGIPIQSSGQDVELSFSTLPQEEDELSALEPSRMRTPRLHAFAGPGLALISPLDSRSQYFPTFGSQLSELDASAQFEAQPESLPIPADVQSMIESSQLPHRKSPVSGEIATSPGATVEAEVDLDALQRQIELEGTSALQVGSLHEAIEVKDVAELHPSQEHFLNIQNSEQPQAPEYVNSYPQPFDSQILSLGNEITDLRQDAEETSAAVQLDVAGQILPDSAQPSDMVKNAQSTSQQDDVATNVTEKPADFGVESPRLRITSQARLETSKFLDGTAEVDFAEVQFSPLVDRPVAQLPLIHETHGAIGAPSMSSLDYGGQKSQQAIMDDEGMAKEPRTQTQQEEQHTFDLLTPQATQVDTTVQEGTPGPRRRQRSLPPTPVQSQEQSAIQAINLTDDITTESELPSQPIQKTPARRPSWRLDNELQMPDSVYSDYFTPRKSSMIPAVPSSSIAIAEKVPVFQEQIESSPTYHTEDANRDTVLQPRSPSNNLIEFLDAAQAMSDPRRGSATNLAYYIHLKFLNEHYNQLVDVLAVCTADSSTPERAKSGPKDFYTTTRLADTSLDDESSAAITAQIFRPRKSAIPVAYRGDIILLRNFKVQTQSRTPLLLSCDESAWAVFQLRGPSSTQIQSVPATMSGPPVEFGSGEEQLIKMLAQWWTKEGQSRHPVLAYDNAPLQQDSHNTRALKGQVARPPPLDIRRSLRGTQQDRGADDATDIDVHSLRSPDQHQISPTLSYRTGITSMPPPSASIASPTSPVSVMTTRSSRSASLAAAQAPSRQSKTKVSKAIPEAQSTVAATPQQTPNRPRTRSSTKKLSISTSPVPPQGQSLESPGLHSLPISESPLNHRPIPENISVVTAESEAGSVQSHRRSRRSTSLIHELRDGTKWVDVEEEIIVPAAEASREGADHHTQQGKSAVVEDESDSDRDEGTIRTEDREDDATNFDTGDGSADDGFGKAQVSANQERESAAATKPRRTGGRPPKALGQGRSQPRRNQRQKSKEPIAEKQDSPANPSTQRRQYSEQDSISHDPRKAEAESGRVTRSKRRINASQASVSGEGI